MINPLNAKANVAQQGEVSAGDRRSLILEAELELKDDNPCDLFTFARKKEAMAPVRFGVRSKAERGFGLVDAQKLPERALWKTNL